jgi:YidC/Oxa1 family membrane protein insertase
MSSVLFPFKWLLANVFEFALALTSNPGLSILILSLFVTLLLLPVQSLIDWFKKKNSIVKERMKAVEEEIDRCYRGQTRYLYLKTLYRQHNYNPINNFISLVIPLIQIPFFLAAYSYLSGQTVFGERLSRPDALISFGDLYLNLLPVIMTLANLLNIELITGERKSEKTMLRFMALFFLLALYNMPSALVLYWTMNNVFLLLISILKTKKRHLITDIPKNWLSKIKDVTFIFKFIPELIFSLMILSIYFFLISYLNPTKGSAGYVVSIWTAGVFGIISLLALIFRLYKGWPKFSSTLTFRPALMLFLLSTFPVVHYAYENVVFLNATFFFELFIFLMLPSFLILFFLKLSLFNFFKNDYYLVFTATLILSFFLTPLWLSVFKVRIEEGFWFQLLLILILAFILINVYFRYYRLLVIMALCLFLVSFGRLSARLIKRFTSNANTDVTIPSYFPRKLIKKPDVYLLIYDAYMDEKFSKFLKIDNSSQFKFLKENGFKIYKDKLSLERSSLNSIAPMYALGPTKLKTRQTLAGHNPIDKFMKTQGYKTYYIAKDYFFREEKENAKGIILTPNESRNTLLDGILQGEFKFETISSGFDYQKWKRIKNDLFTNQSSSPKWVYAHSPYPAHAQFSGQCLHNELELYKKRLQIANQEMKEDIANILKTNPNSIIITAGDHGPYLLGDCYIMKEFLPNQIKGEHLIDRFGVHIAIRWPDKNFEVFDDFEYLQGVFSSVLSYLSEDLSALNHQQRGKVCVKGVCASANQPILSGPDKGKMLFKSI